MFVSLIPMVILVIFQQYFTSSVAATGGEGIAHRIPRTRS